MSQQVEEKPSKDVQNNTTSIQSPSPVDKMRSSPAIASPIEGKQKLEPAQNGDESPHGDSTSPFVSVVKTDNPLAKRFTHLNKCVEDYTKLDMLGEGTTIFEASLIFVKEPMDRSTRQKTRLRKNLLL